MHLSMEFALLFVWQKLIFAGGEFRLKHSGNDSKTNSFNKIITPHDRVAVALAKVGSGQGETIQMANSNVRNTLYAHDLMVIMYKASIVHENKGKEATLKRSLLGENFPQKIPFKRRKRFATNYSKNVLTNAKLQITDGNLYPQKPNSLQPDLEIPSSNLNNTFNIFKELKSNRTVGKVVEDDKGLNFSEKDGRQAPIDILRTVLKKESFELNSNKSSALERARRFRELTERRKYSMNFVKSQNINNSTHFTKIEDDVLSFKGLDRESSLYPYNNKVLKLSEGNGSISYANGNFSIQNLINETNIGYKIITNKSFTGLNNKYHKIGVSSKDSDSKIVISNMISNSTNNSNISTSRLLSPALFMSDADNTSEVLLSNTKYKTLNTLNPSKTASGQNTLAAPRPTLGFLSKPLLPTIQNEYSTSHPLALHSYLAPTVSPSTKNPPTIPRPSTTLDPWPVKLAAEIPGDLILGGLMMVHEREDSVTCGPIMPQGGIQALETMLYTLDVVNNMPGAPFTIGAHILDDCDKDTYGLEMAVDFIKGKCTYIYSKKSTRYPKLTDLSKRKYMAILRNDFLGN